MMHELFWHLKKSNALKQTDILKYCHAQNIVALKSSWCMNYSDTWKNPTH
jgi:hypothetical protein